MKPVKEKVGVGVAYTLMALPFTIPIGIAWHNTYASGLVRNYNQAIVRNADIDGDGETTSAEALRFRQGLLREIGELSEQGRNLDEIVVWLGER